MRRIYSYALIAAVSAPSILAAQAMDDHAKSVEGGGIMVPGWKATVDAREAGQGMTEKNAKFVSEGGKFHITTGPAITYYNPGNMATGDYTVSATFTEPQYMNLNDHDHPYGIVIGGNDLGTDKASNLYCAAYGDGRFIMRGFAPDAQRGVFRLNGGMGDTSSAIHKAAGKGQPVSQDIAIQVKGDKVSCIINGKAVGTYEKSAVVGAGKLKSTDGVYGIRTAHNTEVIVSNFKMTKG
jgi:hypothetical protein